MLGLVLASSVLTSMIPLSVKNQSVGVKDCGNQKVKNKLNILADTYILIISEKYLINFD